MTLSNLSTNILSEITHYMKYSKYLHDKKRRENFNETIDRNKEMHKKKFPELSKEIDITFDKFVKEKYVLPAMRSLQFGGEAIEKNNARMFNCSYQAVDNYKVFSEAMFLLLSGSGVGYSVQIKHVNSLPPIKTPDEVGYFSIPDSIEGWAEAINILVKAYFGLNPLPLFDFSKIRKKGMRIITSGGKAPGPEPLKICLEKIQRVFINLLISKGEGTKLKPIECHSILCHIADAVLSGGIRRAAMICLFDWHDVEMRRSKTGTWYETNPHFARANNSIVCNYEEITHDIFIDLWNDIKNSGSGEPGFFWTNNKDLGTNPCGEASLEHNQFCNLVEINAFKITSQAVFNEVCKRASFINTLQASYTDFHYLRNIWKKQTDKSALLGVGITGIASGNLDNINLTEGAINIVKTNQEISKKIGINQASRSCMIKPSGTSSLVLGTSSGIHDWFDKYYIRRIRVNKNEPIYKYILNNLPDLVEDDIYSPVDTAILMFPQQAPELAKITKNSSAYDILERTKKYNLEWIRPSHVFGENYHNVSATIQVKNHEWDMVGEWIWNNRYEYHGITVLPFDNHTYKQAPFEACSESDFKNLLSKMKKIDLTEIIEDDDNTDLKDQVACSGGYCELN